MSPRATQAFSAPSHSLLCSALCFCHLLSLTRLLSLPALCSTAGSFCCTRSLLSDSLTSRISTGSFFMVCIYYVKSSLSSCIFSLISPNSLSVFPCSWLKVSMQLSWSLYQLDRSTALGSVGESLISFRNGTFPRFFKFPVFLYCCFHIWSIFTGYL